MVSFSCENCGDILTKKKLDSHRNSCRGASFSCLDCMEHFNGTEYRAHTSCISEAQKYQGNLYKPKKSQQQSSQKPNPSKPQSKPQDTTNDSENPTKSKLIEESDLSTALVPRSVYIQETTQQTTSIAIVDAPPRAPSPPPAPVNVFDFLVQDNGDDEWESDDDDMHAEYAAKPAYATHGFEYGARPISAAFERYDSIPDLRSRANGTTNHHSNGDFVTPDPRRSHARKISTDSAGQKKSGKRKRGQPEDLDLSKINGPDVVMTDVPPVHHSGLTGGLHRLTTQQRNGLPPSPDDSPNSPIKRSRRDDRKDKVGRRKSSDSDKADRKRTKHQRSTREEANGTSKTTSKPSAAATKPTASKRRTLLASGGARKRSVSPSNSPSRKKPALKAIEYPTTETQQDDSMALVRITHAPTTKPVASFLDCLAKGTDTDEGVSVWRALKRWRRDGGKESGEKELWKGIKIRMNDRGELIICV